MEGGNGPGAPGAVSTSNSGDVTRAVSKTVGRGGEKSTISDVNSKSGKSSDNAGGAGTQASRGKKRLSSKVVGPNALPPKLSKTSPPPFEDTTGHVGHISATGKTLASVNESDRNPFMQPAKKSVVSKNNQAVQIEGQLSHNRVGKKQRLCTYGSHRRYENWATKYHQQTKGPFTNRLPFRTRNDSTNTGVGSNHAH